MTHCNPCTAPGVNGAPGGGSGGVSFVFQGTFNTVGAATVQTNLGSIIPDGSSLVIRALWVTSVFIVGAGVGDLGQSDAVGSIQCQQSATDGPVLYGPPPYGPPPTANTASSGYQTPLAFATPGGIGRAITVAADVIRITTTVGFAGFTIRHRYFGEMMVFDGAIRIHL